MGGGGAPLVGRVFQQLLDSLYRLFRLEMALCGGTTREDPGMSLGSSGLPGGLCV